MTDSKDHYIKELEQEKEILEELNKCMEEGQTKIILGELSHELRTPMVPIKAYVDMLLEGKFGYLESKQSEKLKEVKKNIDLLAKVVFEISKKKNKQKN